MLNLSFDSAISGTVADKDGEGTGFTSVQPNVNGDQYDPSRINLDTTSGTLTLTATQGSNTANNTLKNALQVGIDATKTFTTSTRISSRLTDLTSAAQQGGLVIGPNQDNYVKLVVINTGSGLGIQFYKEENGVGSTVGTITGLNWGNIQTLDLFLTGDPVTKTLRAAYRVNSDTAAPITFSQNFQPSQTANFFAATTARAGILAFTGNNANDVPVTFNSFGIAQDLNVNFQPSASAVPAGYVVDSGKAYDATRGYGWVRQDSLSSTTHIPLDISSYARDRARSGVDPRLNTLLHMQYSNTPAAAWELAVPNGSYAVTVSVGDQPDSGTSYTSRHTIRVEGVTAIDRFGGTSKQEYQSATVKVNVSDDRLTVDATGGTNTKINYLKIVSITPGNHPSVTSSSIASDSTGIYRNAAVGLEVSLPNPGAGVNPATLTSGNVQLYRTRDNFLVPGNIGTTGGGDAIVYQPSALLDANTNYSLRVTSGVRDDSGATFIPYTTTFNTGTNTSVSTDYQVHFTRSIVYGSGVTGAPISSLVISPDGNMLYGAGLDGNLRRWTINSDGSLSGLQTFSVGGAIVGLVFDPTDPNTLWITDNAPLFPRPAPDFSGKISKLTLNSSNQFVSNIQDYVVGLPRSGKDHLTNSLAFGPDGNLYLTQGSNSAMGAPDNGWYNRSEHLLNATVLQFDPRQTPPARGFNVQTENYGNTTGNYNPYASNAPLKIYATGVRNAYDLVWHSNGNLYAPTNGSAAGGNTPDNPATTVNEALTNANVESDYLYKIAQGGYYGHPNPKQGHYILNGGNPTSSVDPAEVVAQNGFSGYPVGTQPDPNYKGFAYDFGLHRSPDGAIEYKSNTFGGALKNKLLVTEYSGGDDILALAPDASGNIPRGNVTQVFSGLNNPLDLTEDTKKNIGNLYVAEMNENSNSTYSGQISLLRVS